MTGVSRIPASNSSVNTSSPGAQPPAGTPSSLRDAAASQGRYQTLSAQGVSGQPKLSAGVALEQRGSETHSTVERVVGALYITLFYGSKDIHGGKRCTFKGINGGKRGGTFKLTSQCICNRTVTRPRKVPGKVKREGVKCAQRTQRGHTRMVLARRWGSAD